jgi:hypothetical protein
LGDDDGVLALAGCGRAGRFDDADPFAWADCDDFVAADDDEATEDPDLIADDNRPPFSGLPALPRRGAVLVAAVRPVVDFAAPPGAAVTALLLLESPEDEGAEEGGGGLTSDGTAPFRPPLLAVPAEATEWEDDGRPRRRDAGSES